MSVRVGVGLSALVLVMGATASASADELSPELAALDVSGESPELRSVKAKEAPESVDAKAKKGPKEGTQVAQVQQPPNQQPGQQPGQQASPDQVEEEEEKDDRLPPRVPWRGTAVSWNNEATTSAMRVGDDYQSTAHQQYIQTFALGLNYFLIDQDKWSLAVASTPSVSVEITDSGTTTREREPWFNDLPVSLAYRRSLYSNPELGLGTSMVLNGTLILPTSPASYNTGTYLTTSPRLTLIQAIPLLGKDAPVLQAFYVGASLRWDHRFGRSITAVNPGLDQPRVDADGTTFSSDDLSFNRFAQNTLREGVFVFFGEDIGPTQLQVFGSFSFSQAYAPAWEKNCMPNAHVLTAAPGECIPIEGNDQPNQYGYGFAVGATFFPVPEVAVSLGYASGGNQLGPDGQRQSIFYNPMAQFSAGLAISLDAIYEGLTGPRRNSPFFLIAKNDKKNDKNENKSDKQRQSPTQPAFSF